MNPGATAERFRHLAPARPQDAPAGKRRGVRWLKLGLPLVAGALVLLIVAWPDMYRRGGGMKIAITTTAEGEVARPGMVNGRLQGVDRRGQPYTITALTAIQDLVDDQVMRLDRPAADLVVKGGTWIHVRADRGAFHRQRQSLNLIDNIESHTDSGFFFSARSAVVDLRAGSIASTEPVVGQGPLGLL
ncbi:MAG: hypothetical protein FJX47_07300, partial [Alphaproteobacteria bacterium]|nr:hypothetical protein [Alphaproteobacteria bacterium]